MSGRVFPGQSFAISAPRHNATVDATEAHAYSGVRGQSGAPASSYFEGAVLVKNDSGADAGRYGVLGIGGLLFSRKDNEAQFKARGFCFSGVLPAAAHAGRFLVTAEPIGDGKIGRALIAGMVVVPVYMASEDHRCADIEAGRSDRLQSGTIGALNLLWIEPIVDRDIANIAWCVGVLGTGGGTATASFAVLTAKSGSLPPYHYAASQATMDADGDWTQVGGGVAYNNVFNIEEQGAGGQWVNPLAPGDVVVIYPAPDPSVDAYVCTRSHYRGTY